MAWIPTVPPEEADGLLRRLYDQAMRRAGRVFQIVEVMSLNPPVLRASMALYQAACLGPSPLTRAQREALAVVTSRANACHY